MVMVSLEPKSHARQFSSSAGIRVVSAPPMVVAAEAAGASTQTHSAAASTNAAARRANRCRCFKSDLLLFFADFRLCFLQCNTARACGQGLDFRFHIRTIKETGGPFPFGQLSGLIYKVSGRRRMASSISFSISRRQSSSTGLNAPASPVQSICTAAAQGTDGWLPLPVVSVS